MACQPSSILTLFTDAEVSPNLRVTPAIDTVKAVFKHLEDSEGCREFFATTFESLQVGHSVLSSVCSAVHLHYFFCVHVRHVGSADVLCCAVLYWAATRCAVLCCAAKCCACAVLQDTVLRCAVISYAVQC